ncbi:MAG: AI-2E family transporter, partial [Candidatus Competibacterales bacterium]|nr:AI-2E family transporter [Candidatus Competibacterales bacterium]
MLTELRIALWLIALLAAGWGLYLLAPVLTPFLAAALLAYLGDPAVDRLQRAGLSRTLSVSAVFLVLLLALVLLVLVLLPLLQGQFAALLERLPGLVRLANERLLPWLEARAGIDPGAYQLSALSAGLSGNLDQVGRVAAGFWGALTSSSAALLGLLANLVLIPVLTFYLL